MSKEREGQRPKEAIETRPIPALELIQRSWAFSVLDEANLARMRGRAFSRQRYILEKPEIVRVKDDEASAKAGRIVCRDEMNDGHHRFISAFQAALTEQQTVNPIADGSDIHLEVADVTEDTINSSIRELGGKSPYFGQFDEKGKGYITEKQHLALLSLADNAHESLPPHRMPAHFLNKWSRFVGEDIAGDFPAFPALLRVGFASNLSNHMPHSIAVYYTEKNSDPLFTSETDDARKRVIDGYTEFAEVVSQRELSFADVAANAFGVITGEREGLGDTEESFNRQIRGFASYPELAAKIADGVTDPVLAESRTEALTILMAATVRDVAKLDDVRRVTNARAFYEALVDPDISYSVLLQLLKPHEDTSLKQRYQAFKDKVTTADDDEGTQPRTTRPTTVYKPRSRTSTPAARPGEIIIRETPLRTLFLGAADICERPGAPTEEERRRLSSALRMITRKITDQSTSSPQAPDRSHAQPSARPAFRQPTGITAGTLRGHLEQRHTLDDVATALGQTRNAVIKLYEDHHLTPPPGHYD